MEIKLNNNFKVAHKKVRGHLTLPTEGITLILGNNGVGKTSLFNHLLNHQQDYKLEGITSFISQYRLAPVSSVKVSQIFKNIEKDYSHRAVCPFDQFELISRFGAQGLMQKNISSLSGGENQLIKILLGFYLKAQYYFMDEPFQFLDKEKFQIVFDFIVESKGLGMVIIDHRNPELFELAKNKFEIIENNEEIFIQKIEK